VQFPIVIGLHRSRFLGALVLSAVLFGAVTIVAWPQPLPVRLAGLAVIAIAAALAWRRTAPPCIALRLERDGAIAIQCIAGGEFLSAEVLPGGFVHRWLTVVRLRDGAGRMLALPVAVDSAKPADFRRLRLFLRWAGKAAGTGDGR
jgi:toxin CptA